MVLEVSGGGADSGHMDVFCGEMCMLGLQCLFLHLYNNCILDHGLVPSYH